MNRNNRRRGLLITSNDVVLLLLAYFAYRNGLWIVAILFAVAAVFSTAYLLLQRRPST